MTYESSLRLTSSQEYIPLIQQSESTFKCGFTEANITTENEDGKMPSPSRRRENRKQETYFKDNRIHPPTDNSSIKSQRSLQNLIGQTRNTDMAASSKGITMGGFSRKFNPLNMSQKSQIDENKEIDFMKTMPSPKNLDSFDQGQDFYKLIIQKTELGISSKPEFPQPSH